MGNPSAKLSRSFLAGVFGFFLAAFVLVTSARLSSVDDKIMFDVTKSMLASGSFASSEPLSEREFFVEPWFYVQGKDGKAYSKYGLGQSLAIVPLFAAGKSVLSLIPQSYADWFPPDYIPFKPPERIGHAERLENTIIPAFTSLLSPTATAVSCLLIFVLAYRLGTPLRSSLILAALFGFTTAAFPYAKFSFHHPLVSALILASFYGLFSWKHDGGWWRLAVSGGCLGFAALTRYEAVASLAIFIPYIVWSSAGKYVEDGGLQAGSGALILLSRPRLRKIAMDLAPFVAAVLVFELVVLWFNFARFGSLLATGYIQEGFTADLSQSVGGLLFSPGRSIFLFSPPITLGLACLPFFAKRRPSEGMAFIALVALYFLLYAKWSGWEGGWAWGSRYPLPVLPYLVLPLSAALQTSAFWPKALLLSLAVISLPIQLLGVATSFNDFYMERTIIQGHDFWPTVYEWDKSQIPGQMNLLSQGIVDMWFVHLIKNGAPLGLRVIILLPLGLMVASCLLIWRGLKSYAAVVPAREGSV